MAEDLLPSDPGSVGPYRLIRRLGTGGMGQVYLASSPGGRLVAVKVIRPELAADPGFRSRFEREVRAARSVSGMFTAPVVDADAGGQPPWLATAYVPGPSLADAVAEHGPLPPDVVFTVAAGLAEALVAIHAAGLVHRDLKPSNVLLAGDRPRVIDFGISRAADASVLTQTGVIMGSPGYFSPEQAEGRPVGSSGDMFSLGAVLAFAASGEGPFGTGPVVALAFRVVNAAPNLSGVPEQLRPMIERCLAKDPAARPTPGELLASLAAGNAEPHWLSQPPAPNRRAAPRVRLGLIATAAALLAASATGIALAVSGPGTSTPVRTPAQTAASPDGVWTGTYDCSQGLTGVRLTITGPAGGALKATIDFYPVAANPGVSEGSYELVGSYSAAEGLVLNPDYWVDEPAGYEMVGLSAPPPHANSMRGSVHAVGCSTFSVTR
jgi:eukaryotic-like serine/threonine-protein kinase